MENGTIKDLRDVFGYMWGPLGKTSEDLLLPWEEDYVERNTGTSKMAVGKGVRAKTKRIYSFQTLDGSTVYITGEEVKRYDD